MDYLLAMRLFVRSVELGSFSKSAASYGLKASSVSRHISSLEKDLSASLFRRSTRQLLLTDAGAAFYDRAFKILAEVEEARRSASASVSEPTGSLKLWAPREFGRRHISHLLPKFMLQTPGLSVDFTLGESPHDNAPAVFDVAITTEEPSETSRSYAQRFARNRYVICGASNYLERSPEPSFPSALRDHNCLIHGNASVWQFGSARSTVEVSVEVAGNFRSNWLEPILSAALAGVGFARLPLWLAGDHLRSGRLRSILTRYEVTASDSAIYGVHPERRSASPKIRAILEFLTAEFGAPPSWE